MALKTKAKAAKIGEALGKKSSEFTFIDPPLINVPHTEVTKLDGSSRQLPDPSKTLKLSLGIERVSIASIKLATDEKGPDGEPVLVSSDSDPRIRFVGEWRNVNPGNGGFIFTNTLDDFIEITFFGTGLNILGVFDGGNKDVRVTIDGGAESGNIIGTFSSVLNGRHYPPNTIVNVASGLSLAIHTVKLRLGDGASDFPFKGFEILNEDTQVQVLQGEIFTGGNKFSNDALAAIDYNTGFDGSPALNGRGGRVSVYMTPEGEIKKAIQQTDVAQLNLGAADHSNEEVIRKINFREFGVNRTDDFSTLAGATSNRAFTLDDGTTTLSGENVLTGFADVDELGCGIPGNSFFAITFVGTGLDIVRADSASTGDIDSHETLVDGSSVGTFANETASTAPRIEKVVSGLPYGTHTVKIRRLATAGAHHMGAESFIIYGPKKPSIPVDAQEIGEYYLMADYDGSIATGEAQIDKFQVPQGTLFKAPTREFIYEGLSGGDVLLSVTLKDPPGMITGWDTAADNAEYTFWGTGCVLFMRQNTSTSHNFNVQIDGVNNDGNILTPGNVSGSGGGSGDFSFGSAASGDPIRIEYTGLSLGLHTIRISKTNASTDFPFLGLHVITPVHFPNTKRGSLSMGPGIQLQKETSTSGLDLGRAKAWIIYDMAADTILDSFNISAVSALATGVRHVFFEKPFKTPNYVPLGSTRETTTPNFYNITFYDQNPSSITVRNTFTTSGGLLNRVMCLAFFGELEKEEGAE